MVNLDDNHRRHLLSTFRYVDQLLDEAEHILLSGRSGRAFPRYASDTTPVQGRVLRDHFARIRESLLAALPDLGLKPGSPEISMLRALRVQIVTADIALEEVSAHAMRGYGPLSAEAAGAVERAVAELRGQLHQAGAFLEEPPDRDLQARLERLSTTADETRLLFEVERVVTAHGLVELRPALAVLVERFETRGFEVGVFGRVSSGKSSLLNRFVGRDVLPVGVTPITAVPTRLGYGREERVVVDFAERQTQVIPLEGLVDVATERGNPANRLHVTRIAVELPADRLASGVTFVDTPGVGSIATAGAEETMAYLPRCDLGLLLVDAASSLSPQDLALVRALYQAGATAAVLLSKADLLTPEQREEAARYVRTQIAAECGVEVAVSPVSVVGPAAALADEWFENELLPRCQRQGEEAALALRRKVGALRDAVVAALRSRLERQRLGATRETAPHPDALRQVVAQGAALPDAARASCEALAMRLEGVAEEVVDEAAALAAAKPRSREGLQAVARDALALVLQQRAGAVGSDLVARLNGLRDDLSRILAAARELVGVSRGDELPRVAGLPAFDEGAIVDRLVLDQSPLDLLGRWVLRRRVAARMTVQLLEELTHMLRFHRRRLVTWSREIVAELERAFDAEGGALDAGFTPHGGRAPAAGEADPAAIERDLDALSA